MLVGDFLLGQAFRMMVEVGSLRALDILSAAATVIAEGEVMQLTNAKNIETDEAAYLAVIRGKTAELFAAACEVGPVLAGRPKAEQDAARAYGMNLGIAFQLIDDVLDYGGTSAELGKNVGDDFARARSRCRSSWPTAGERGRARLLAADPPAGRDRRGRPRHRPRPAPAPRRPGGDGGPRPPVRRPGPRRPRHLPGRAVKAALNGAVEFCVARAR